MSPNLFRVFSSSVGTKLLIGLTGVLLVAYMVLHVVGNALIFLGRDTFNEYSHMLVSNPLIVPIEIGLLLVFVVHIYKAISNWRTNPRRVRSATKRKSAPGIRAARAWHPRR